MTQLHQAPAEPATALERTPFEVEIHDLRPHEAAVISISMRPDDISTQIGSAFEAVATAMAEAGVALDGPPFTRYLSFGPVIEAEAGFPVLRPAPDVGRVHAGRTPGGRVASLIHVGPYYALEQSYSLLMGRLGELGLQPDGPMWEIYWTDPDAEPDPSVWRTELLVPVAERVAQAGDEGR